MYVTDQQPPPSSGMWETPSYFFEALDRVFAFDLDACATEYNAKCPMYWSEEDNALTQPWIGSVFMNPPFADGNVWVPKARDESFTNATLVVGLILNSTDTAWWHQAVMNRAAWVWLVRGRIPFEFGGQAYNGNRYSNVVVLWEGSARHRTTRFASVDALAPVF